MKGTVTMQTLGQNGRFANQVFQYAFLRFYAREHGIDYQVPDWEGRRIFGHNDKCVTSNLPRLSIHTYAQFCDIVASYPPINVDFWGYFQDPAFYAYDRAFFYSLFTPRPELEDTLSRGWEALAGYQIIGLHMRYGDYGYGCFYETPVQWVLNLLEKEWPNLTRPLLFLASDDMRVKKIFKQFSPVCSENLFPVCDCPAYYYDFWSLAHVNHMLITSNSSFSFASSMLNMVCSCFFRPSMQRKKLITFEPWRAPVLLDESSPLLDFLTSHPKIRSVYNRIRRSIFFGELEKKA